MPLWKRKNSSLSLTWSMAGLILLWGGCTPRQPHSEQGGTDSNETATNAQATNKSPRPPSSAEHSKPTSKGVPAVDNSSPSPALLHRQKVEGDVSWAEGVKVSGPYGVVTSVEDSATRAGIQALKAGGNAVDAAIATAFALAVTHPSAGNIGGGGFLLLRLGDRVEGIDFRENSPRKLNEDVFWKMIAKGGRGPRSVGVPGTVAGLYMAHSRHGRLPWKEVVAEAERLAREGYLLGARQANTIRWAEADLRKDPVALEVFFPNGKRLTAGMRVLRPRLAKTLKRIAEQGAAGFYQGPVAEDLIASLGPGALLDQADLSNYKAMIRQPLYFDFDGHRVITMPSPSAGGVALAQNLLILRESGVMKTKAHSSARAHLVAEASRRAQVERQLFVVSPDELTPSDRAAARTRALNPQTWLEAHPINKKKATPSSSLDPSYPRALKERENTTHFSVVDADGGLVSCTVTLSGSFGARVFSKESGVVFNNSVASFSSIGINTPKAAKRTTSSMAPTLVLRGDDALVLGSPGGDTIPSTITQTFLHLVLDDFGMKKAVAQPRFHQGFAPDRIVMERFAPLLPSTRAGLVRLGHEVKLDRFTQGDANIAAYVDGIAFAVADKREGGLALAAKPPSLADSSKD